MKTEEGKMIKEYLHLYMGCEVQYMKTDMQGYNWHGPITSEITGRFIYEHSNGLYKDVKPILRPLSDMNNDEKIFCDVHSSPPYEPEEFIYLLKQGYDLFGLIESGLAIDKTKTKSQ